MNVEWKVCNHEQNYEHACKEREHLFRRTLKARLTNCTSYEERTSNRWCAKSDCKVEDKHDSKVYPAHSNRLNYRKQNRGHDDDQRCHIHEASEEHQKNIDDQQDDDRIVRDSDKSVRNGRRNP